MNKTRLKQFALSMIVVLNLAQMTRCEKDDEIIVPQSPFPISNDAFSIETIVDGFTIPYGISIVSEDEYFITDRVGKLFHFQNDILTEIDGIPSVSTFGDPGIPAILHGGLMDVSIHPNFANNSWIYISYLADDGHAKVSRFKIENNSTTSLETIFTTRSENYYGNGMRIEWQDQTHFFLNVGGSTLSTNTNPILIAQDLNEDALRVNIDVAS